MLSKISNGFRMRLSQLEGSSERSHQWFPLPEQNASLTVPAVGASWQVNLEWTAVAGQPDAVEGRIAFRLKSPRADQVTAAIELPVESWSPEVFVLVPAAAYNGNRYPCRPYSYPPLIHEPADLGPDAPILVTDVPRLRREPGPSRMQLTTGDTTTPCLCFYHPGAELGVILLTEQGNAWGNHGLTVEESDDRRRAVLRIESPAVRRETLYTMCTTATPSWDRAANLREGDEIMIRFRRIVFPARCVQDLYHCFCAVRADVTEPPLRREELPFSAAWRIVEEKYQRENWCEEGYYHVAPRHAAAENRYADWQTGWVGGGMVIPPLLLAGGETARKRAKENLDWMFRRAQYPSGLFCAGYHKGEYFSDGFNQSCGARWVMVRKQADALYFLLKSFLVLRALDSRWSPPESWAVGVTRLADRLVDTYRRFGQLGQFLDAHTGDVVVGGSTAAALAGGALALMGEFFRTSAYLPTAEALARDLYERDVKAGVTTGGPGEILSCPDSESAFALLESFVVLYETTRDARWLRAAEEIAEQCLTWCASYDYRFPATSWMGRLDIRSAGSVWANVQNKHSAPAICTLSGDSLLKLFRYTGRREFLDQIAWTAHNLPQYLCRADRPLGDPECMKPGYICERVNFSDWEGVENIGGSLFGSCWPEVSLMLTTVEIPGLYVQPDAGLLCVFDNLEAEIVRADAEGAILQCRNPTKFDAQVRVLAERSADAATTILGQAAGARWPVFDIPAGKTVRIEVRQ